MRMKEIKKETKNKYVNNEKSNKKKKKRRKGGENNTQKSHGRFHAYINSIH
jgi:hypothetical protein